MKRKGPTTAQRRERVAHETALNVLIGTATDEAEAHGASGRCDCRLCSAVWQLEQARARLIAAGGKP